MKSPNPYVILLMQQALKKQGIIVIFLFLFNLLTLLGRDSTFMDASFLTFWGYGYGYANVLEFLGFLIFTLTPIYFFSSNLTQHSISQTNFVVVRLRRKKNWLAIIQASTLLFCLFFYSLCFLYSTGPLYPRGGKSNCVVTGSCTHNRRYCIHF